MYLGLYSSLQALLRLMFSSKAQFRIFVLGHASKGRFKNKVLSHSCETGV